MTDTEIAPASREEVEKMKNDAVVHLRERNTAAFMVVKAEDFLSLIAWGEAAERRAAAQEPVIYPPVHDAVVKILDEESAWIARPNAEVDRRIALACTIAAFQALRVDAEYMSRAEEAETLLRAAESRAAQAEGALFNARAEKILANNRAAQDRAAMRGMAGALQTAAPHVCSFLCQSVGKTGEKWRQSPECQAIAAALSTPPAAVALAEREVVEAARRFAARTVSSTKAPEAEALRDAAYQLVNADDAARAKAEGEVALSKAAYDALHTGTGIVRREVDGVVTVIDPRDFYAKDEAHE